MGFAESVEAGIDTCGIEAGIEAGIDRIGPALLLEIGDGSKQHRGLLPGVLLE